MKAEGIVLDSIDYKESSKIVHLYTASGKMSIRATGASNPKKGLLGFTMSGNAVSFVATDSALPSLTEYETLHSTYSVSEDFRRANVLLVILDVLKGIPEDSDHQRCYPYAREVLERITEDEPLKLLCIFLVKMLYAYGVAPNLKSCVSCGSKDVVSLDVLRGGAFCKGCHNGKNSDELRLWTEYYYEKKKTAEYPSADYRAMLKELRDYYSRYTHITLKIKDLIR